MKLLCHKEVQAVSIDVVLVSIEVSGTPRPEAAHSQGGGKRPKRWRRVQGTIQT